MSVPNLQTKLHAYLMLRESLGYKSTKTNKPLENFVQYLNQNASGHPIRAQYAVDWACGDKGTRGVSRQRALLSLARCFLRHLKVSVPDTEVPGTHLLAARQRPIPYIFSHSDILSILRAAGQLGPYNSLRPVTYETLFGLLACTGLRTSEALNLLVSDVQLDEKPARLLIRLTKFGKSRWVPIHPTAAHQLREYLESRRRFRCNSRSGFFFVSDHRQRLAYPAVGEVFRRLIKKLGISPRAGQREPSLHSFRHSFATERLKAWYQSGADVHALSPNLSVYLGHVDPTTSYWYLTATPELLDKAADYFEKYANGGKSNEEI
jgi:integrase